MSAESLNCLKDCSDAKIMASSEIVVLDVGGTLFKTTVGTLTSRDAPNFFTSQLSGLFFPLKMMSIIESSL